MKFSFTPRFSEVQEDDKKAALTLLTVSIGKPLKRLTIKGAGRITSLKRGVN